MILHEIYSDHEIYFDGLGGGGPKIEAITKDFGSLERRSEFSAMAKRKEGVRALQTDRQQRAEEWRRLATREGSDPDPQYLM